MLFFFCKLNLYINVLPNEDDKEFHGAFRYAVAEVQEGFPFLSHPSDDNPETHREDHQTEDVRLTRLSLGGFICDGLCKKGRVSYCKFCIYTHPVNSKFTVDTKGLVTYSLFLIIMNRIYNFFNGFAYH